MHVTAVALAEFAPRDNQGATMIIKLSGDPIKRDLSPSDQIRLLIADYMDIDIDAVQVTHITRWEASVLICEGRPQLLVDGINTQDPFFDDTILEDAFIPEEFVIFGVDCIFDPSSFLDQPNADSSTSDNLPQTTLLSASDLKSSIPDNIINTVGSTSDASSISSFGALVMMAISAVAVVLM
jgi:hypothetical protein